MFFTGAGSQILYPLFAVTDGSQTSPVTCINLYGDIIFFYKEKENNKPLS